MRRRSSLSRLSLTTALLLALGASLAFTPGCSDSADDDPAGAAGAGGGGDEDAGSDADTDADTDGGDGGGGSFLDEIPLAETLEVEGLKAPVDLVRDEWGVPHIYGDEPGDVAFAQGYIVARDRFPQMDLMRRSAAGTLGELVGVFAPGILQSDLNMRMHGFRAIAQASYDELKASEDAKDALLVRILDRFADGVNLYLSELKAKKHKLPEELNLVYTADYAQPWTAIDSLLLGQLQAHGLAFDAEREINATLLREKAFAVFDQADPGEEPDLAKRSGLYLDLTRTDPVNATFTIDGFPGIAPTQAKKASKPRGDANFIATLEAASRVMAGTGMKERGSNNWVVGKDLSATGNVLLANDPHLGLNNPPMFYMAHLAARSEEAPINAMGVAFPGIPGLVLGMNEKIAWGATTSYADVTDVYAETIVTCEGTSKPCVVFNGNEVPLVPREEQFGMGIFGDVKKTITVTLWDVPHHGPIIPRANAQNDGVEPLGESALSIRYTGHQGAQLFRAIFGINVASSVEEAMSALEGDFAYGGQNWVFGDTQGNIGWTQSARFPLRAPTHEPWLVLPGDGSAEWKGDIPQENIPHAYNPAKGYIATANADPVGVTKDNDPFFGQPQVDGSPLYLGAVYDPGTRIGRITKLIEDAKSGQKKLSLDDLQAIQADVRTEWGERLQPTLLEAAEALAEEIDTAGSFEDLEALAEGADEAVKALLPTVIGWLENWSFDTPAAVEGSPTPEQIRDSQATLVFSAWLNELYVHALGDELRQIGVAPATPHALKLLTWAATTPAKLSTGLVAETGDSILFDDLETPDVIESKRYIAAKALLVALDKLIDRLGGDPSAWRWGELHTVTLEFLVANAALAVPTEDERPNGFPRPGTIGTVDVAGYAFGEADYDFTSTHGPAMRFVCELTPEGPKARNVLPGGQVFDPKSPHYRDQMDLWRNNQSFDVAFTDDDVKKSALAEWEKNQIGRIRFVPR